MNIIDPKKFEFIALYRQSGWSQAELARKLEMTRGGVNGIITGPTVPSLAALKLFRLMLVSQKPEALAGLGQIRESDLQDWERKLLMKLRYLSSVDRDRALKIVDAFISGIYESKSDAIPPTDTAHLNDIALQAAQRAADSIVNSPPKPTDEVAKPSGNHPGSGSVSYRPKRKSASTSDKIGSPVPAVQAR